MRSRSLALLIVFFRFVVCGMEIAAHNECRPVNRRAESCVRVAGIIGRGEGDELRCDWLQRLAGIENQGGGRKFF